MGMEEVQDFRSPSRASSIKSLRRLSFITGPSAASFEGRILTEWEVEDVVSLCHDIGLSDYCYAFQDAQIDGRSLAALDHESLRDLGIRSVGKRLCLLRAVYEAKVRDGIDIDDGDWLPPYEPRDGTIHNVEADERVRVLKGELDNCREEVESLQVYVTTLVHKVLENDRTIKDLKKARTRSINRPSLSVDVARARRSPKLSRKKSIQHSSSSPSFPKSSPLLDSTPTSGGFSNVPSPATATIRTAGFNDLDHNSLASPTFRVPNVEEGPLPSPLRRLSPSISKRHEVPPSPRDRRGLYGSPAGFKEKGPPIYSIPSTPLTSVTEAPRSAVSEPSETSTGDKLRPPVSRSASTKSHRSGSSHDTCMQILPAACKKYALKAEWSEYVMIVAYGSQKRALSYDERPRVVVDELKRAGSNPVSCLVQHSSELRSPLALATSRRHKAFRRLVEEENPSSEQKALPPQQLPTFCAERSSRDRSSSSKFGFAVFPYSSEEASELDLEYGEPLLILSRDERWVIVQRLSPESPTKQAGPRSGSVPASCIIETHVQPPLMIGPHSPLTAASTRGSRGYLDPSIISTANIIGWALVDRTGQAGELDLHKGDRLRVYVRCSHWYWCQDERGMLRGWAPAWMISCGAIEPTVYPKLPEKSVRKEERRG